MISKREKEEEEEEGREKRRGRKRERSLGGITVDRESGKKTLLPTPSLSLSLFSHSKEGTQPGLD